MGDNETTELDGLRERILAALQECNDDNLSYDQAADLILAALKPPSRMPPEDYPTRHAADYESNR
jgi:hypothetical protein